MKRNVNAIFMILILIGLLLSVSILMDNANKKPPASAPSSMPDSPNETTSFVDTHVLHNPMEVHFIDVGQGDSTLIINGEQTMLIDAGPNDKGTLLQYYLMEQGVDKLDYLILTHTDADHIGGADVILTKFDVDTVLLSGIEKENSTYQDVLKALDYKHLSHKAPSVGTHYSLGDASFTIIAPHQVYEDSNDNSLGLLLQKGEWRFLFTGDATKQAEEDMLQANLDLSADVYKVAHHGSTSSSSQAFLEAVSPSYAVISCSRDNPYGHPHSETLEQLSSLDVQIYRTDEQGSIIATCDGVSINWSYVKADASTSQKESSATTDSLQSTISNSIIGHDVTYICNTNSMKFHLPACTSVDDMADRNKLETTLPKEELLKQGYIGCKVCNP
ncbi:MAG: MBL fold metallo-hydrolase [Lachnospiraceae bacterium]|nr:MBL fold metallo-hydrolase [Lachnospiraceae bacterium]